MPSDSFAAAGEMPLSTAADSAAGRGPDASMVLPATTASVIGRQLVARRRLLSPILPKRARRQHRCGPQKPEPSGERAHLKHALPLPVAACARVRVWPVAVLVRADG